MANNLLLLTVWNPQLQYRSMNMLTTLCRFGFVITTVNKHTIVYGTALCPLSYLLALTSLMPTWWRHQMETFSALLAICAGNSPVPGEFPTQRPVTRSFDVYFDLRTNKRLSKRSWGWWFETLSWSLWRHYNELHLMVSEILVITSVGLVMAYCLIGAQT